MCGFIQSQLLKDLLNGLKVNNMNLNKLKQPHIKIELAEKEKRIGNMDIIADHFYKPEAMTAKEKTIDEVLNECIFDNSIKPDRATVQISVAEEAMKRYSTNKLTSIKAMIQERIDANEAELGGVIYANYPAIKKAKHGLLTSLLNQIEK